MSNPSISFLSLIKPWGGQVAEVATVMVLLLWIFVQYGSGVGGADEQQRHGGCEGKYVFFY